MAELLKVLHTKRQRIQVVQVIQLDNPNPLFLAAFFPDQHDYFLLDIWKNQLFKSKQRNPRKLLCQKQP